MQTKPIITTGLELSKFHSQQYGIFFLLLYQWVILKLGENNQMIGL